MKIAILTGASSGLGIQFARQLKRVFPEVEELWLIARRQDRLEALAAELTDLKTVVLPLDLCREESFTALREKLAAEIAKSDKVYENIERFLPLIWKYTGITELTPYILNELIEKIVVHEKTVGSDGIKTQQVDIYYKFIGCINQRCDGGCTGEVIKEERGQKVSHTA